MSSPISPSGVKESVNAYYNFTGMETNRDKYSMETGENQLMLSLLHCYAHWQGYITNEPCIEKRHVNNDANVIHVNFFGYDNVAWAQWTDYGISLDSDAGHRVEQAYPAHATITSTVFNHRLIVFSRTAIPIIYDGVGWYNTTSQTGLAPQFGVAIQRRLFTAGVDSYPTRIFVSRMDDENYMTDDEAADANQVTKATDFDIGNMIGTADYITGLGALDSKRLAIFTNDQVLIYLVSPDYTEWSLEDRGAVRYGTLSHNTIQQAGQDLIYCSRTGVHSIRRNEQNGITFFNVPLSNEVDQLYKELVNQVDDWERISACYNSDMGQYHIFFPINPQNIKRLTLTFPPTDLMAGQNPRRPTWSMGEYAHIQCAAFMSGKMVFGTAYGVWNVFGELDSGVSRAPMEIITPVFWHKELNQQKSSRTFMLQAHGEGDVVIQAFDEQGRELSAIKVRLEDESTITFPDVPISRQYERKFEHRYRGVQFKISSTTSGKVKIYSFGVSVRK